MFAWPNILENKKIVTFRSSQSGASSGAKM